MNDHHPLRLGRTRQPSLTLSRLWLTALVISIALLYVGHDQAQAAPLDVPNATLVSGSINANTTWTVAGSPYEVTNLVTVQPGVTLTLEPGVEVIVAEHTYIRVFGSLVAEGTANDPIIFSGSTAQSGWWYGIDVSGSQVEPAAVTFNYVTVQHTGFGNLYNGGALQAHNASTIIRNSVFQTNGSNGLNIAVNGSLQLEDSTFTNNGLHAIRLEGSRFDPQLSNLTATGSGTAGEGYDAVVYVQVHWEEGDHVLEPMGLPYVFEGGFSVEPEGRLVIQPGVEVRVDTSFYVYGELSAVGSAAQPIIVTGIITDINVPPKPWWGLQISGNFGAPAKAQLEYVTLDHGGLTNADTEANLSVSMANVTVRNSIIRNGSMHGIYNSGGAPSEPTSLLVENTTFTNNAGTAIVCTDESCNQTLYNLTATGNGLDAMRQRYALRGNVTWTKSGLPYVVDGFTGIDAGGIMVIEPGVEIRMGEDTSFQVYGTLFAVGTAEEPILFTGTQAQPGWWESISVHDKGILELRHCDVGYGGAPTSGLLDIGSTSVFVSNCKLHHSAQAAVRTYINVTPFISHNLIEQNVAGIINNNGTGRPLTVDARNNWWGSPSGPTHASNPGGTGNSVSDLVLFEPWLTSPEQANNAESVVVQIGGVGRYSPGETVQYAIGYLNPTAEVVEDAILRVALPANSKYIDSTGGGIYWPEIGQVYWKLGDLAPGAGAMLAVRVTYDWGLPDGLKTAIVAQLGGQGVDEAVFNINDYLAYAPRFETNVIDLSAPQVQTLRASDPDMDAIYDQAEADGYLFGSATERTYNTGEKLTQVILTKVVKGDIRAFIIWQEDAGSMGVALDGLGLTAFKPGRGLRYSLQTKLWEEVDPSLLAATAISWSDCMINCIQDKLPGETVEQLIKVYSVGKKVAGCVKAASGDEGAILECSKVLEDAIPGYGVGVELGTCNVDCQECEKNGLGCDDDKCHCCTADKYRCSSDDWLYGTFGIDVIMRLECKDGMYLAEKVETVCALCEKCVMGGGVPVCTAKASQVAQVGALTLKWVDLGVELVRADLTLVSVLGDRECEECRKAKDPNKITGPTGDLLPGQLVTYTIEYENVGTGEAFGVFIVNPLSEHFDLETLTVTDPQVDFSLSKPTRRIYFTVGDLAAKGEDGSKGEVTYSVRLKTGLPSGTVIINDAVVHFPSVPEETPTNTAVNTIQPIAVPSQQLQVVAGQPLAITLRGQDVSGGALTYAIVEAPLYGTLTGTPPALTYTPQADFTGIDRLLFTANNGTVTSRAAEVVIEVLSAGNDSTAPAILWTGPAHGETVNSSQLVANLENGALYSPYIQIQFSEAMAASTINTTTVQLYKGVGQVVPISVQYDATINQAVVLMHEQGEAGGTYDVSVTTGVTDLAGNPLVANNTWSFHFGDLSTETSSIFLPQMENR